jgi:hypothetical protein
MILYLSLLMACDSGKTEPPCSPTDWYIDADEDGYGDPFSRTNSCSAPEGSVDNYQDCNDQNSDENPEAIWYRDIDGDGYGDELQSLASCIQPIGYILAIGDCDDLDSTRNPNSFWYVDDDEDGYGDTLQPVDSCSDISGASNISGDCDDQDWFIHPAANEVCDQIDNDCDDAVDDDDDDIDIFTQVPIFQDSDGDGYGTDEMITRACSTTSLGAVHSGDCDDFDSTIYPHRLDYLDSIDSDCDGETNWYVASSIEQGWIGDISSSAFGITLATKDIDGDGFYELLVGMYNANDYAGGANLIPGNLTGDKTYFPEEGQSWTGELADDKAGYSLNFVGDWNGDGVEDIAIGAPYQSENTGIAYIISSDMPSSSLSEAMHTISVDSPYSNFGYVVYGAGDLNGDTLDDVFISAKSDDREGNNRGSVSISYGGDTASNLLAAEDAFFGESNGDQLGFSIAMVDDADGDGIGDFLVGAPYCDDGNTNGGCVYLLSQTELASGIVTLADTPRFFGLQDGEHLGMAVSSAGDFDGDGLDDIIMGAPDYDNPIDDEGAAYVVLGRNTGWQNEDVTMSHLTLLGVTDNDKTGRFIHSIGDIDGDAKEDIIIVSHNSDAYLGNAGLVYGILGGRASGSVDLISEADFQIVGESTNDYLGRGVGKAGDINSDGLDDFWLGASGASSYGTVYLLNGISAP